MQIEKLIYVIRGQKVMLDSDLAELYGVETKVLNQAVKRNISRFPEDFMIECSFSELEDLRSQIVTSNDPSHWKHKRWTSPLVFTEVGIAMLSSVLRSERAIQVNISIMRTFIKLRSFYALENANEEKISKLEQNTAAIFKVVFQRMDSLEAQIAPRLSPSRRRLG